jgi:O-antigen/teichoic acid export membrane protein
MSSSQSNQRRLALGLGKTGGWFAISRIAQVTAGVWITRLLNPEDFTLLAVIFAIQGFAQQISALNLSSELVRAPRIEKEDLEVAWSFEFVRNTIIWLVLAAAAPWFSAWMEHPEITSALRLSACGLLIGSFLNPRLVELRRQGMFGRLGWMDSAPLLAYALFAVLFVWIHPDYISLIYAGLASNLVGVVLSYQRLPWRPRFNFDCHRVLPMLSLGLMLLLGTGFFALREHGIVFIVSACGFGKDLGYLNRGIAFSMALAFQAVGLFWKVAYPHYASVHLQGGDVIRDASVANRWLLLAGLPAALLAGYFSESIIHLALGEKWLPVATLWSWLVLAGAMLVANAPLEATLQAVRREKIQMAIVGISTGLHLTLSWLLLPAHGITAVGMAACASTLLSSILLQVTLRSLRVGSAKHAPQL